MDGGAAKPAEARRVAGLDPIGDARDERAHRGVLHERRQLANDRQPSREVPVQIAVDGRVIEPGERAIELRDLATEIREQFG